MTEAPETHARDPREAFAHVDTWVFDLDNTLYPANSAIFPQIERRITEFVERRFTLETTAARKLQKDYYHQYGTTLRGLMVEHGVSPDEFLAYVHDVDTGPLEPNPALGKAIAALPGRKLVLTNGTAKHARNITARLGIADEFAGMFGIIEADYVPKPARETYDIFTKRFDIDPSRAAMFEDLIGNLDVPKTLGMVTTLVVPAGTRDVLHGEWEVEGRNSDPRVDFVTEDITAFLGLARTA